MLVILVNYIIINQLFLYNYATNLMIIYFWILDFLKPLKANIDDDDIIIDNDDTDNNKKSQLSAKGRIILITIIISS